ncbi:DUF2163 domain-containing protein [Azorhizobium caulinodans]|uniref:DUF2163 domain-containing protein n=1 Tax=Azorhizobium caulinodans TaxID=7 RepID=UPI002FBEC1F3
MRRFPDALSAALQAGATTFCNGWRITRRDGHVQGFTDHDRDLVIDGVTFHAASGISASESTLAAGLAVTGMEVSGALSGETLEEAALAAGLYDGALLDFLLIDWQAPETHVLLRRGTLGEVRRQGLSFTAELRGLADGLNQTRGRVFSALCDADLGDARCGIVLSDGHTASGVIAAMGADNRLVVSGPGAAAGSYTRGRFRLSGGAGAGFACEVKAHVMDAAGVVLDLWQALPEGVVAGDAFEVTAGCDKQFATCRDRFANARNFRGCPHMPGNDFVFSVAALGEAAYDGGTLA